MNPTQQSSDGRSGDWSEGEKIELALEIFRQRERRYGSRLSAAQVLFDALAGFQPDWEDLPLPPGRTVLQGRHVYTSHSGRSSGPSTAQSTGLSPGSFTFPTPGGSTGGVTSRKRSAPSDSLTSVIGRPLAPKQPPSYSAAPESGARPSITGHQQPISPMVEPPPRLGEPRKKRGRPTKQEAEERRRQVEERNQARMQAERAARQPPNTGSYGSPLGHQLYPFPPGVLPGIPRETTPSSSIAGPSPAAVTQTPRNPPPESEHNSSGSSGKKRKARPPRLSVSESEQPSQPPFPITRSQQASSAYESPPNTGSGGRPATRPSGLTSGPTVQEQERFNVSEDNRPQQSRSRPWEEPFPGRSQT